MVEYLNKHFDPLFLRPSVTLSKIVRKRVADGIRECIEARPGTCREVIAAIVRYHRRCRDRCCVGHPILQIAMKLSYSYRLQDSDIVSDLLREVYLCENGFEKLFAGAIFGVNASYLTCGWKSDFSDVEENVQAIAYFLKHSNKARCLFGAERLAEVTMKSCGLPPVVLALQVRNNEIYTLLRRYGAGFSRTAQFAGMDNLKQLCKNKILYLLWENWELPSGIGKLPLPIALIKYLEKVDFDTYVKLCKDVS